MIFFFSDVWDKGQEDNNNDTEVACATVPLASLPIEQPVVLQYVPGAVVREVALDQLRK